MKIIPWVLLVVVILLEGTLTTAPLVINFLIILYVITRRNFVFGLALTLGIFLDLIAVRTIGISSLLFLFFIFLIILYERKFEIQTMQFIFLCSFIATSIMFIFNYHYLFVFQAFLIAILTTFIFKIFHSYSKTKTIFS